LALVLAAIAYRPLLKLANPDLEREIEGLLFHSTSAGPPVVLVIALWLLYRRWHRLRRLPRRLSLGLGLGLLLPSVPIYAWATYTGAVDLLIPALMLNVLGFGALLWGAPALRILWLPTLFLLFAMRLPTSLLNQLLWKLQIWTAQYTGFLLNQLGMLSSVSGDQITRPGQKFAIIETCAGLRSTESLTILSVLMVDLFRRQRLHGLLLVALAPLVAFGVNGLRAVTLILNPHSEIVAIHNLQGVAMLLLGLLILYAIDGVLERILASPVQPAATAPPSTPGKTQGQSGSAGLVIASALLAVLVGLSETLPRWEPPLRGSRPFPEEQIPKQLSGWTSSALDTDLEFLGIVRFRARIDRLYQREDEAVRLFVGVGRRDGRDGSPFSPKTAFPGSGWWVEQAQPTQWAPEGREVHASVMRFGKGTRRRLVFAWNEGTRGPADEVLRFLVARDQSRWARPREGVALRIGTQLSDTSPAARASAEARLREFYREIRPSLGLVGYPRGQGH
jgi:EpsI family protein